MKRNLLIAFAAAVAFLAMAAAVAFPMIPLTASAAAQPPAAAQSASVLSSPRFATIGDLETALENIYDQVNPSVVLIETVDAPVSGGGNPNFSPFGQGQALGSGFVWDSQGNIVTNNHVVDGAGQITVTFADGNTASARLVGADPDSDLAVIKVDASSASLRPVQLADSSQVKVGQMAIAIGNPYGEQNTMTTGIISAIGRSLPAGGDTGQGQGLSQGPSYSIPDVIQTDAPINPGNSGGVLLNSAGQLIGVTQSIESPSGTSAGIGFAIPSAIVQRVVPSLVKSGKYTHPYLGISGTSLNATLAQAMGLKPEQRGALVSQVTQNGPAAKAGLQGSNKSATVQGVRTLVGGDVIIAFNGQSVKTFDELIAFLSRTGEPNQTVRLTILRDGKQQDVSLTLGARPSSQ